MPNGLTCIGAPRRIVALGGLQLGLQRRIEARRSRQDRFAHLFEHLMFGGSINIPSYDEPIRLAGGENNAFTNNDITNYYITFTKGEYRNSLLARIDRMLSLAFSKKSLEVQRNVVIEEFNQRYLNQPYGDVWLLLRPLVYKITLTNDGHHWQVGAPHQGCYARGC